MPVFEPRTMDFFKRLIEAPGPSGHEEIPRRLWREEVKPYVHAQQTDVNGSEIATINGRSQRTSFLLMGHIDQIGLIVRYIDKDGYIYFQPVGGVDVDTIVSTTVRVMGPKGIVPGVIGKVAPHLTTADDKDKKLKIHELWIDIGARSREEAEEYAPVGTPVALAGSVTELLNDRIAGRLDNRFGAFVIAEVLKRLWARRTELFATVHGVATTQEETHGNRIGATSAAWRLNPTAAIAIDVNHSIDIPSIDKRREGDMAMGKGAILTFGVSSNNRLARAIETVARAKGIPLQRDVENGRHGTDADALPTLRAGVPVVSIGHPLRYMHNSVETGDLKDIKAVVDLLEAFLLSIDREVDYTP